MKRTKILQRVNKEAPNGCWEWVPNEDIKGLDRNGVPFVWYKNKMWYVHRLIWVTNVGEIPPDLVLKKKSCTNKLCVCPDHHELVKRADFLPKKEKAS